MWDFSREVHRLGFDAVEAIIARYGQQSDLNLGIRIPGEEATPTGATLADGALSRDVMNDARDALHAWFQLMTSSFESAREQLTTVIGEWAGGPASSGDLQLPDTHPGRPSAGTFWVRMTAPGITGRYSVETDGLVGPGGFLIPPEMMAASPDSFALISGIKQKVELQVAVPQSAPGGRYRGFLKVPHGLISTDGNTTEDILIPTSLLVVAM